MRVAKKHDVRLNEILDAAETLFTEKGYEHATVNDILDKVGIGKGTLYHYFKSKEEVMDGVINRLVEYAREQANAIVGDRSLPACEKMQRAVLSVNISEAPHGKVIDELHKPSNAQMHQKSIIQTIQAVAPVLAKIVEQGIREGIYSCPYPLETVEFLLAASQFIFDDGIFRWDKEDLNTRAFAFVRVMERSLGAAEGSFRFLLGSLAVQLPETGNKTDE